MTEKEEGTVSDVASDAAEIEAQARSMGWVEKEGYNGKGEWVDAAKFIERGHTILPIVQATNRKLVVAQENLQRQLNESLKANKELRDSVKDMQDFHEQNLKEQVARVKAELKTQLVAAKKEGDVEREVELEEQLQDLREKDGKVGEKPTKKDEATSPQTSGDQPPKDEAFEEWRVLPANAWFGKDRKKTAMAIEIGREVADERADLFVNKQPTAAYYAEVGKRVAEFFGETKRAPDKTSGARGPAGRSTGSKGYDDLPADAKEACKTFEAKLVGPNKVHKTAESYRAAYAKTFFTSQEA